MPGPFVQPLGRRGFGQVWSRQLRWARLRRVTFKLFFAPELAMGGLFPIAAAAFLAAIGALPPAAPLALAILWYGAEAALAAIAGWRRAPASLAAAVVRDLLLPPLWFAAWAGNGFTWRGHDMRVGREAAEVPGARWADWVYRFLPDDTEPRSALTAAIARRWRGWRSRNEA